METPFYIHDSKTKQKPILLSSPHSGVIIPDDLLETMNREEAIKVSDTDWFIDRLYGFGPDHGYKLLAAKYSRFVVDLNRPTNSVSLYSDGRKETGLVPHNTFSQKPLYSTPPDQVEVERRVNLYYKPYHNQIKLELDKLKSEYKQVLLFDCHSIARKVPAIQAEPFPDLILGNQDNKTCAPELLEIAKSQLGQDQWTVAINHPFKGGHITRNNGKPNQGIHAIQLEMSQDVYLNKDRSDLCPGKAASIQKLLLSTLNAMSDWLGA